MSRGGSAVVASTGGVPGAAGGLGVPGRTSFVEPDGKKQQGLEHASHPMVRKVMGEEVLLSLKRTALLTCLIFAAFAAYDYLAYREYENIEGRFKLLLFLLARIFGTSLIAGLVAAALFFVRLKGPQVDLANLIFVIGPTAGTVALLLTLAPARNVHYAMALALFQLWYGYTTLSLSTSLLFLLQLLTSGVILGSEAIIDQQLVRGVRVVGDRVVDSVSEEYVPELIIWERVAYLLFTTAFMVVHNRKRRSGLRNHAKLLHEHQLNMDLIAEEVAQCQSLLQNIFPPEVLQRLTQQIPGFDQRIVAKGESGGLAERFDGCTFLFAKVCGLKQLTELTEQPDNDVDPSLVVEILQMIFDRFDALADTFKVQKIRKTVNEAYLVAAGLPDPLRIEDPKERCLAISALAFAMVHVMDIVNSEPVLKSLGMRLECQIGLHSGTAIAGIIGHKRFQYDLCGDAVNTAARMCAYAAPGCIGLSDAARSLVCDEYETVYRGEKQVKGKGNMKLFFLIGRTNAALKEVQMLQRLELVAPASAGDDEPVAGDGAVGGAALPPPPLSPLPEAPTPQTEPEGDGGRDSPPELPSPRELSRDDDYDYDDDDDDGADSESTEPPPLPTKGYSEVSSDEAAPSNIGRSATRRANSPKVSADEVELTGVPRSKSFGGALLKSAIEGSGRQMRQFLRFEGTASAKGDSGSKPWSDDAFNDAEMAAALGGDIRIGDRKVAQREGSFERLKSFRKYFAEI